MVVGGIGATTVFDGRHALGQLIGAQAMDTANIGARAWGRHGRRPPSVPLRSSGTVRAAGRRGRNDRRGGGEHTTHDAGGRRGRARRRQQPAGDLRPGSLELPSTWRCRKRRWARSVWQRRQGRPTHLGWAADRDGRPTTDPTEAIAGMLLPVGGAKGFGLALAIGCSPACCPVARRAAR